jgi:apolipoprotein N-acyltransferase
LLNQGLAGIFNKLIADKKNILLAILSGLLLTASFPKIGLDLLAWGALVPLLWTLNGIAATAGFRLGFIAGLVHFLSLLYWVVPVMLTYGYLPLYLSVSILFLFAAVLAVFIAGFAAMITRFTNKPERLVLTAPIAWIALEYLRSFIFSGFPWELLGYSQFKRLQLIQISDIFGVFGISALIVLANAVMLVTLLYCFKRKWHGTEISIRLVAGSIIMVVAAIGLILFYGNRRLKTVDKLAAAAPTVRISVVQGNIDQAIKWDPAFQIETVEKYQRLSLTALPSRPDLIVWPESAAPFYFLYDIKPSELVFRGIQQTATDHLIGSPSFVQTDNRTEYYNSAYLINPNLKHMSKYDKAHLVPFGEYVPFKKWLPFLGKIVAQVGDFQAGEKGETLPWRNSQLGVQICYEIIFPYLSRALARNDAALLLNITNDAWFGKTSGPYQHFSMTVFRAVENRRALARAANTGISGFIDPAGRILVSTPLLAEAVATRSLPLLQEKAIYTRFGDVFAQVCFLAALAVSLLEIFKYAVKLRRR